MLSSIYLSDTTSSLISCSNLLYLLREYTIASIKNNNAVMQPIALPTIIFTLLHLSSVSLLSLVPGLEVVKSKLNTFSLYFQKTNKLQ